jgi:hypothetical protein
MSRHQEARMDFTENPFRFIPDPYGTNLTFSGGEDAGWVVDANILNFELQLAKRVRFVFPGVVQARINDDMDRNFSTKFFLTNHNNSPWINNFLEAYEKQFGLNFVPAVRDVQHFVLKGHDLTIGIIARKVICCEIQ